MNKPWGKEFGYYGKDWTHYSFLAKETCKFLNDNFRGSVIADPGDVGLNKVLYEMESYTHFIRMVFDFVFGFGALRLRKNRSSSGSFAGKRKFFFRRGKTRGKSGKTAYHGTGQSDGYSRKISGLQAL